MPVKKLSRDEPKVGRKKTYKVIGRTIAARLNQLGKTRRDLAIALDTDIELVNAIISGRRRFPEDRLAILAGFLVGHGESARQLEIKLRSASGYKPDKPRPLKEERTQSGPSGTHLARGLAKIRIGYVPWEPFASPGPQKPHGLLVEFVEMLCELLAVETSWQPVEFNSFVPLLENGQLELIIGFVLETVRRHARARFVPLHMPFALGINAVTQSERLLAIRNGKTHYMNLLRELQEGTRSIQRPIRVIVIRDEVADEYLPAVLPGVRIFERSRSSIEKTIADYGQDDQNVIFADHFSCAQAVAQDPRRKLELLFNDALGRFQGGFLLPADDPELAEFFRDALHHLLNARLPRTGLLLTQYADPLSELLVVKPDELYCADGEICRLQRSAPLSTGRFPLLQDWLMEYWPKEIAIPPTWQHRLKHVSERA